MEGRAVSGDGTSIAYETRGDGEPALVLVHGWSCDRLYWRHQLDSFSLRHQVVAVDLGGHGESGTGRREWTMEAFGEDVVAVADALGLRSVVLIGHSMGGDVIVATAARVRARLIGLVWVDTYRTLEASRDPADVERIIAPLRADFARETEALVRSMFLPTSDPALVERVARDMASAPPEVALSALQHALTFLPAVVDALARLRLPVVSIHPAELPADEASLTAHGVSSIPIPGVGHFPMLEDPKRFDTLLQQVLDGLVAVDEDRRTRSIRP